MTLADDEPVRYLLGELSDAERDALEQRMLDDDDVHELMCAAEDELYGCYDRDELAGDRRARFEVRFLRDAVGWDRLATTRALLRAARQAEAVRSVRSPRRSWARRAAPVVAVALAAVVAVAVWPRTRSTGAPPGEVIAIALVPPTRSVARPVLHVTPRTHRVRLELDLDRAAAIVLRGPSGQVAATLVPGVPPVVEIDAALLAPGDYTLVVSADGQADAALAFTVAEQ